MNYTQQVPPLFPYNLTVDKTSYFSQYRETINIPEAIQIQAIYRTVQENELIGKHYLLIEFHPSTIFHPSDKFNNFVFQVKHKPRLPEIMDVHMKDKVIGNFRQEYIPKNFDKYSDVVAPIALQPDIIVAYKLETRIRDSWVLTVALNSCPTFGKALEKVHHLQLQTL